MNEISTREEQLLRMVGEERGSHAPKLLVAVERELARRAGGTRRQAFGRIRTAGTLIILLGLCFGAIAVGLYAAVVIVFGPQPGLNATSGTAGVIGLVGLAVAALGVAVMLRVKCVLRWPRVIPFLRPADVEAATYTPDTAELLRLVGPARADFSPDAVEVAGGYIRERLQRGRAHLQARVISWGGVAVLLGVLMVINGAGLALILLLLRALETMGPQLTGAELVSPGEIASTWVGAIVNAALGVVLFAGGLGLRAHKDWGRRTVLWSVWISFAATLLAGVVGVPPMVARSGLTLGTVLSLAATVAVDIAWLLICWWLTSVLCRPEVKEACGVETPLR